MTISTDDHGLDGTALDIIIIVKSLRDEFDTVEYGLFFIIDYTAVYCSSKLSLKNNNSHYYYRVGDDGDMEVDLRVSSNDCRYTVSIAFVGAVPNEARAWIVPVQATFEHEDPNPATNDYINLYKKLEEAQFIVYPDI